MDTIHPTTLFLLLCSIFYALLATSTHSQSTCLLLSSHFAFLSLIFTTFHNQGPTISFIKDETINIHRYLSGIPSFISDKIQYDDPKNLEETIRRDKCLYDQQKEILLSRRLGRTRRSLGGNRGRRRTSHHFSETILKKNHLLESTKWLR
jgi:hypothetical protein